LEEDADGAPVGRLELAADGFAVSIERMDGDRRLRLRRELDGVATLSFAPADPETAVELVGGQLARGGRNTLFTMVLPGFLKLV